MASCVLASRPNAAASPRPTSSMSQRGQVARTADIHSEFLSRHLSDWSDAPLRSLTRAIVRERVRRRSAGTPDLTRPPVHCFSTRASES